MTTRQTLAKCTNKSGVVYALVSDGLTFEVWVQCENYSRECKGAMKRTWRYVQKGMAEAEAIQLFERRVGKLDALTAYYAARAASTLNALAR